MLLLALLALAAAWAYGLLKQTQDSITRKETETVWIDCTTKGISDFQSAFIHRYRHKPSKDHEWILNIASRQAVHYDYSNRRKYSSVKKGGFAQEIPIQSPISITKFKKSARMSCEIQVLGGNFDAIVIHWYQQKEGKAPERLLFFTGGKATVDPGFQANRYMAEKVSGQNRCALTIKDVIPDDAATYYCAYWDTHCDVHAKIIKAKRKPSLTV